MATRTYEAGSLVVIQAGSFHVLENGSLVDNDDTTRRVVSMQNVGFTGRGTAFGIQFTNDNAIPSNAAISQVAVTYRERRGVQGSNFVRVATQQRVGAGGGGGQGATISNLGYEDHTVVWTADRHGNPFTVETIFDTIWAAYITHDKNVPEPSRIYDVCKISMVVTFSGGDGFSVRTVSASDLASSTATLNGTVNPAGATADFSVKAYFEWGEAADALDNTTAEQEITGSGDQDFEQAITGLIPGRQYFFRAAADNTKDGSGVVYGDTLSFRAGTGGLQLNEFNTNYTDGWTGEDLILSLATEFTVQSGFPNCNPEEELQDVD